MDHRSLSRPNLPGTTATPSSLGKTSVYATRAPPHFENVPRSKTQSSEDNPLHNMKKAPSVQRILQERGLAKIVDKLPYELRESVTSVLNLAFSSSEHIQKDLEFCHHEIAVLRSDLSKKTHEMQTLQKTCEIYKSQLHGLEENIDSLKDNIDSRKRFTTRNRSAMSRLATTNRMLIDALDALQNPIAVNIGKALPNNPSATGLDVPRTGQLSPLSLPRTPKGINHKEYEEKVQRLTMSQNDKLRESLLKIAREHYKSLKNAEHLETKVTELKAALKAQENLNRNLKSELDEIKAITQVDTSLTTEDKHPTETLTNFKAKNFGQIDDRIQNLIDKNLFDPIDGIQQLRRILAHMASAPNSLSLHEMIVHAVSRDAVRIFGSDMICLFLVKPGSDNIIHKFSGRSNEPTTIEINLTKSIAVETIRSGKVQRVNSIAKNSNYNEDIDGCSGVVTRRVLSLPLFNTQHSLVIGSLQFLNKGKNFEVFTEADEVFGLIFAHQTSLLLTSCVMYDALFYHSQLLRGLLEASTDLYSVLPDATAIATKPLTPAEVISAIERTARELFKCPGVKCFLLSDFLNLPNGQLLMLDTSSSALNSSKRNPRNASITLTSATSGVAGLVVQTKKQYIIEPFKFDPYLNPSVDLDPLKYSMLTTPIIDLRGNVLGCLQLLVGTRSPRLKESDDPNDFRMLFPQAAEWFTHQIAPPLKYILSYLDRPAMRPVSTPSKISRSSMDVHHRASFFSNSEEVVTQMMSIASQFQEEDSDKQLGDSPFISVPFRRLATSKSFSVNPIDVNEQSTNSPSKIETEDKKSDENNAVLEMLRNQLIEKQNEYEEVFEQLQKSKNDFEEKEMKLKEKNRLLEEKSKNKIIELEEQYYAKQEITRKEFENKMSLLQDEIKSYKDEIAVLQENHEGFENNLNYQLEIRLEFENKIADLQQKLKEVDDLKTFEIGKVSSLETELSVKNNELNELQLRNSSLLDEYKSFKSLLDQKSLELQQSHEENFQNQQLILELQKKLQEKDSIQTILQEQIVRLAGQNIKDINTVMTEVNQKMGAVVSEQGENNISSSSVPNSEHFTIHQNPTTDSVPDKMKKDLWIEQKDMLGRIYYYNEGTGQSSWTDPRAPQPNSPRADKKSAMKGDWLQQFDESGNEYWVNQITGQSEWVIPDEIQRVGSTKEEHFDIDEDEPRTTNNHGAPSIFDTVTSQYSATAGDYTIEL